MAEPEVKKPKSTNLLQMVALHLEGGDSNLEALLKGYFGAKEASSTTTVLPLFATVRTRKYSTGFIVKTIEMICTIKGSPIRGIIVNIGSTKEETRVNVSVSAPRGSSLYAFMTKINFPIKEVGSRWNNSAWYQQSRLMWDYIIETCSLPFGIVAEVNSEFAKFDLI